MGADRSDAFVFFGATGDLAFKQIFPALAGLIRDEGFDLPIIGVARSGDLESLRERARQSLQLHGVTDAATSAALTDHLRYVKGSDDDAETFHALRRELGTARHPLHYLAVPPVLFGEVVTNLAASDCATGARIIVEKPFGRDLASAIALNATIHEVFDEGAVFRIDHYMGKEPVQNLLYFRFANSFLEPIWNRDHVSSVQINMPEALDVADRGTFYDRAGAIRDVVQNHLLEVVSLLAMEPPSGRTPEAMRNEQFRVIDSIRPLRRKDVVRGQYRGYLTVKGVAPDSTVETFAVATRRLRSRQRDGWTATCRCRGKHSAGRRQATGLTNRP
jgi:glucose-6-phosphate 1-dehydrogenase